MNFFLAIIIPAYKSTFLSETLLSIANQENKNFSVYIGDDNSPEDIKSIVDEYKSRLNIYYTKFDKNLGGYNLTKQWERCIKLAKNEKWIWLFSDDDIMHPMCVQYFYNELNMNSGYSLYHFDVTIIDERSKEIAKAKTFPSILSSKEFLTKKIKGQISSFVVEYIFRKDEFYKKDGFVTFDLAWNSDDATWIKLGKDRGIKTIAKSKVKWRASGINISRDYKNIDITERKLYADINYIKWLKKNYQDIKIINLYYYNFKLTVWFLIRLQLVSVLLGKTKVTEILKTFRKETCSPISYIIAKIYFLLLKKHSL
ncbi:glycosyltransferase [Saccharicrinis aurantiacus]|uniref:glycosyltransferase n=1 Tax=Saccharicrinis aurantiacus TaxID=1849719 RepID=UPI00249059A4|nr:glycosyltransferase [Saccharicrinis aurantiacus]